jgi:predicted RNase H-like HicB family nuclease
MVSEMQFVVTLERDEDGFVVAECPSLPGCLSQGKTRDEALANIREAIEGYLASLRKHGEPLPSTEVTSVEVKVA